MILRSDVCELCFFIILIFHINILHSLDLQQAGYRVIHVDLYTFFYLLLKGLSAMVADPRRGSVVVTRMLSVQIWWLLEDRSLTLSCLETVFSVDLVFTVDSGPVIYLVKIS